MKKAFCLRVSTTAARCAAACFFKTPARSRCRLKGKGRARHRLTGIRTRGLAAAELAKFHMGQRCVRFKASPCGALHVRPDLRSADNNVLNKLTRWPIFIYEYMPPAAL
jgi:hypothetical protein